MKKFIVSYHRTDGTAALYSFDDISPAVRFYETMCSDIELLTCSLELGIGEHPLSDRFLLASWVAPDPSAEESE